MQSSTTQTDDERTELTTVPDDLQCQECDRTDDLTAVIVDDSQDGVTFLKTLCPYDRKHELGVST